jgi:hypothetical protein
LPDGSVAITFTVSGVPAVPTSSVRTPISVSDGSAVNVLLSATEMFDASVVSASTSYVIGNGRSFATVTLAALFPLASTLAVVSSTSVAASGCWSGQNHCRPNANCSRPLGVNVAGERVTVKCVDAPFSGAPKRYAFVAVAATVPPRWATSRSSARSTLKFGALNSATRNVPSICSPFPALARSV